MGKIVKVFIDTQPVIIIDDEYYEVELFIKDAKLKKGCAYIRGDLVYIYRGKIKSKDDITKPGIYKDKDGGYIIKEPSKKEMNKYSIDNVTELSTSSIFDIISAHKDEFIQPEDVEIINNNSEIYIPTIKSTDDFLKYIVKKVIIDKKISLRNYKGRFSNEYALNNMKSGLNKSTKMTVNNFVKWMEVLGVDWELRVYDNGTDEINPLTEEIIVTSKDF